MKIFLRKERNGTRWAVGNRFEQRKRSFDLFEGTELDFF